MTRHTISADTAPAAVGPYSHAASGTPDGLLFLSGQTPIDPASGALVEGGIELQTRRIFANLAEVLAAATLTLDDVVKASVYLTSMDDFAEMNKVYGEVFTEPYPARTTVAVAALPLGAKVEIEVVAARR
ncbi:Rid family detoxifying hydrolase [Frondihabitans australicus]|uniref:2-iminobutanoate/2-iminopropanoate deaminase n=1 Tax=Frondihabitans australicus TaxID=386892 RepID=A0A495IIV5_9MICO|nr:Rid family detoxifying hydrolase [Frondihabitans australicus]RKR75036.1 2-iminobutanoate/2-iminopropanoate deaminase [Frondihabitans australicus]